MLRQWWLDSLTPSANVAMLAIIASFNAVWGYPLVGILSALTALMVIALIGNRWFRPRLRLSLRMPAMVSAGNVADAVLDVENIGGAPCFDVRVDAVKLPSSWRIVSAERNIREMSPGASTTCRLRIRLDQRGEFTLPTLHFQSTFPFQLFRTNASSDQDGVIVVSPGRTHFQTAEIAQWLFAAGVQRGGYRVGQSLQYAGSREYNRGDAVRRWDYAAWARLGRPTLREFDHPSNGNLTIVVDTFLVGPSRTRDDDDFEYRLSIAATIIESLRMVPCTVHLLVPQPSGIQSIRAEHQDQAKLLRPLAVAKGVLEDNSRDELNNSSTWQELTSQINPEDPLICIFATLDSNRKRLIDSFKQQGTTLRLIESNGDEKPAALVAQHD